MDEVKTVTTVAVSFFGILSVFFLIKKLRNNKSEKWELVGYLDEILIHPIKGCRAKSVPSAFMGWLGVQSGPYVDRIFMVAFKESGKCVTMKEVPKLALLEAEYSRGKWTLQHPECQDFIIEEKFLEFNESNKATGYMNEAELNLLHVADEACDEWFTKVLGVDCKLLYHYANTPLRAVRKKFVDIYPDEFTKTDFARCAWTSQTTVISWASINDVSQHLGFDVDHRRWRTNFMVQTFDEKKPYQEDNWIKISIGTSGAQVHKQKQCHRCVVVNVDPDTGIMHPKGEPLKTLNKFRPFDYGSDPIMAKARKKRITGPALAINCGLDHPGLVQVGDPVYAVIST